MMNKRFCIGRLICKTTFLASSLVTIGCSNGLNQDPFAGSPEYIKGSLPKNEKPGQETPRRSDAIRLVKPDIVTFRTGKEDRFSVSNSILSADYEFSHYELENAVDFPGAQFDSRTGEFTWNPGKALIPDGERLRIMTMKLAVFGKSKIEGPLIRNGGEFTVRIERNLDQPAIQMIDSLPRSLREGESILFRVKVVDTDGGFREETYPRLEFAPVQGKSSILPYLVIDRVEPDFAKSTWIFYVRLNLANINFTPSSSEVGLQLRAVSMWNRVSIPVEADLRIFTRLMAPETTWDSKLVLKQGAEARVPFFIFEGTNEALVSIKTIKNLPQGAKLQCSPTGSPSLLACEFTWTPTGSDKEKFFSVEVSAVSANRNPLDFKTEGANLVLRFAVEGKAPNKPVVPLSVRGQEGP